MLFDCIREAIIEIQAIIVFQSIFQIIDMQSQNDVQKCRQ